MLKHPCVEDAKTAAEGGANANAALPPMKLDAPMRVKKKLLKLSTLYCGLDFAAFSSVEGEGFLNLAQTLVDIGVSEGRLDVRRVLPHRTAVSKNMEEVAGEIKVEFAPLLQEAIAGRKCGATTDMWTQENKKIHMLAVIVHIPDKNGQTEARTAFTVQFEDEKASGDNIWAQIVLQFQLLGIEEESVRDIVFVTDQGSNVVSAFKDRAVRLNCTAHVINTVLKTALTVKKYEIHTLAGEAIDLVQCVKDLLTHLNTKLPKQRKFPIPRKSPPGVNPPAYAPMLLAFSQRIKEITTLLQRRSEEFLLVGCDVDKVADLLKVLRPLERLMDRFKGSDLAGSLWPEVQALIKNSVTDSPMVAGLKAQWQIDFFPLQYAFVLGKCKALVTHVRGCSINAELKKTLKKEMEVRWNTALTMFESIHFSYEKLSDALEERGELSMLENVTKETLQMYIDLLTPFKDESIVLQADKVPTLQRVCFSRAILTDHCNVPSDIPFVNVLKSRMKQQIERVFKYEMPHKMAIFLWPSSRKQSMLTLAERNEVHSKIRRLLSQAQAVQNPAAPPPPKRPRAAEAYRKYLEDEGDEEYRAQDEIDRYLWEPKGDDSDLLGWWRSRRDRFPDLAALAEQLLVIPATSTSSEREFSEAGHIYREKRLTLQPATTSSILFVNSNADLLKDND